VPLKILEHFPIQDLPARSAEPDDQDERASRLKQVQRSSIVQKPVPIQDEEAEEEEVMTRPGELYRRYRTVDELPDNARAFYKLAGKLPH
jgi:RNA polymerase I-specific transcription initiation factor RRN7